MKYYATVRMLVEWYGKCKKRDKSRIHKNKIKNSYINIDRVYSQGLEWEHVKLKWFMAQLWVEFSLISMAIAV